MERTRRLRAGPQADWQERFLEAYRQCGVIAHAARAAGVSAARVRRQRARHAGFAAEMAMAEEEAADALELEARRRAVEGVSKTVFYGGQPCGEVREYSDRLLALLLRGHRPEWFAGRQMADTAEGAGPIREVRVVDYEEEA